MKKYQIFCYSLFIPFMVVAIMLSDDNAIYAHGGGGHGGGGHGGGEHHEGHHEGGHHGGGHHWNHNHNHSWWHHDNHPNWNHHGGWHHPWHDWYWYGAGVGLVGADVGVNVGGWGNNPGYYYDPNFYYQENGIPTVEYEYDEGADTQ